MDDDDDVHDDLALVRQAFNALKAGSVHAALESLHLFFQYNKPKTYKQRLDAAHSLVAYNYRKEIQEAAEELCKSWRSGEYDGSRDAFEEAINAAADVSNTGDALTCLLISNNDGAYAEEHGEEVDFCAHASMAYREDLLERIKRNGVDVNARPPEEGSIECSECDKYKPGEGDLCDECREDKENDDADNSSDGGEPPG